MLEFYRDGTFPNPSRHLEDPPKVRITLWQPHRSEWFPLALPLRIPSLKAALQYGIMHHLGVFKNREYSICSIYEQGTLGHVAFIYPAYFRFPFMGDQDLQIGDTWTRPRFRGRGLAALAIASIAQRLSRPDRNIWYVCDRENKASMGAVQKAGFVKVGEGRVKKRWGLNFLGVYEITDSERF